MFSQTLFLAVYALLTFSTTASAQAQDPFIGQLMLWPSSRYPSGWAPCNGQSLSISQNTALFSILGTIYGGDGQTTFNLPDLRNRVPISYGSANGGSTNIGETGGSFAGTQSVQGTASGSISIATDNLPPHTHEASFAGDPSNFQVGSTMSVATSPGQLAAQAGGFISQGSNAGVGQAAIFAPSGSTANKVQLGGISGSGSVTPVGSVTIASTGNGNALPISLPVSGQVNIPAPPFLAMQWLISLQGVYPTSD